MIEVLYNLLVIELEMTMKEIFMIFLHDVFDLIEIFFRELITVLENVFDFVVDCIERIKILFLEVSFLGLIC